MQFRLPFTYSDYHRAILIVLSSICGLLIIVYFELSINTAMWLITPAVLTGVSIQGKNKLLQTRNFLIFALLSCLFTPIATLLDYAGVSLLFYCLLFLSFFVLLCIPRFIPLMSAAVIITIVFMIISASTLNTPDDLKHLLRIQILGILGGVGISICVNLLLPTIHPQTPPIETSNYFYKRAFRISLSLVIGFLVGYTFHFSHIVWLCFSILLVSRANTGATVRRSLQRLVGTVGGVIVGVPASQWLFGPYPILRWFVLFILFFLGMLTIIRMYHIGIFCLTLILAGIYYVIMPHGDNPIAFIIDRLLETFVGIFIALLAEIFIFPRSVINLIKSGSQVFWKTACEILIAKRDNQELLQIKPKLDVLDARLSTIKQNFAEFKYEPLGYLTLRYHLGVALIHCFHHFIRHLKILVKQSLEKNTEFDQIISTVQHINALYQMQSLEEQKKLARKLIRRCNNYRYTTSLLSSINKNFIIIFKLIHRIRSVPVWKLRWSRKRRLIPPLGPVTK